MSRHFVFPLLLLVTALLLNGCARTGALTEVGSDGSFTRTLTFRGASSTQTKDMTNSKFSPLENGMKGPDLEELVTIPKGSAWSIHRGTDKSGLVITATRSFAAGETITDDIGVRAAPKSPAPRAKPRNATTKTMAPPKSVLGALVLGNELTVRQIEPGKLEYREVLHWRGTRPAEYQTPTPKQIAQIRAALPESLASDDALIKAIALRLDREALHLVFGPGEPLLPLILFNPDLAEYRLKSRFRRVINDELLTRAGDRLTEAERGAMVAKLLPSLLDDASTKAKDVPMPGGDDDSSSGGIKSSSPGSTVPVSLFFRVKLPGKVLKTNGTVDADSGEVIWAMYSEAAAIEDVEMTATCETGK